MNPLVDTRGFVFLSSVRSVTPTAQGLLLAVDDELLRVDVLREDIFRLKISATGVFDEQPTHAAAFTPGPVPTFRVEDSAEFVRLSTSAFSLRIDKAPFALEATRPDGTCILRSGCGADGVSQAYGTVNDRFVLTRRCTREDAILGLGEKSGPFNRAGRSYVLWNQDIFSTPCAETAAMPEGSPVRDPHSTEYEPYYVSIPFFYHLDGHAPGQPAAGFFIDNGYKGHVDFTPDTIRAVFHGGQYTEYVFAGPSLARILEGYTWITGRMAPPPLWSLGYHQCRWHPYTQQSFLDMTRTYRAKGIPCDVAWIDIDYMDGFRVFTWDQQRFPDVPGMLAELRAAGLRAITIIDPGVKIDPGYSVYDQGLAGDHFCRTRSGRVFHSEVWPGRTAFPDFSRPAARAWWGGLNAAHVRTGIDGIWNDMNEPALFLGPNVAMEEMAFDGGREPHARYHNQYAMLMAMGTAEGLQKAMPDRRTFILSRAGSAGIQRYAANWMGDNSARWEHLQMSLPMAMGFGLSGQPFVGADIGGFAEPGNGELLARWTQCAALTPFCRNHTAMGLPDKYPWSFGPAIEAICRAAIEQRYRLLPYLYAAFLDAAETGAPVQRPLVFAFQEDRAARDIADQYLLGPSLLVAPILRAGESSRPVYLPAGTWFDWNTGECLEGRRFVVADAPLDRIPLYVRAGAVVAMLPEAPQTTMHLKPAQLDLHAFVPPADGAWTTLVQEDDGLTTAWRDGRIVRTALRLERAGNRVTLTARRTGKGFAEFRRERLRVVPHGATPRAWQLNGFAATPDADGTMTFSNRGDDFDLVITMDDDAHPDGAPARLARQRLLSGNRRICDD